MPSPDIKSYDDESHPRYQVGVVTEYSVRLRVRSGLLTTWSVVCEGRPRVQLYKIVREVLQDTRDCKLSVIVSSFCTSESLIK